MKRERQYRGGFQVAGLLELARTLREQQTPAELLLWKLLRNRQVLGFKFRRQHQFGNYIADFYGREANLIIECDGPVHDMNEQLQHDQLRDACFAGQGVRVLRCSNERVLHNTSSVIDDIIRRLPSPFGRGAGGEGLRAKPTPSPLPSPKGRGRKGAP